MLLVVPVAAARLARGGSRVDRYFFGTCVLLTFLLIGFVPRRTVDPALAAMATFAFSGLVALVYLVLSPFARRTTPRLLAVLAIIDISGLAVVHFSAVTRRGQLAFSVLLLAVTMGAGMATVWVVERTGRKGAGRTAAP